MVANFNFGIAISDFPIINLSKQYRNELLRWVTVAMISTIFIYLVIIAKIQDNEAKSTVKPYQVRVDNAKNKKYREELAKIIDYLNTNTATKVEQNESERSIDTGNHKLEEIMELAQKNYDAKLNYELKQNPDSPVRILIIKNPGTLQKYMKSLREGTSTSSESDSTSYSELEIPERKSQRKNAERNDKDYINDLVNKADYKKSDTDLHLSGNKQNVIDDRQYSKDDQDIARTKPTPFAIKKKRTDGTDDLGALFQKETTESDEKNMQRQNMEFVPKTKDNYDDYENPKKNKKNSQKAMWKDSWEDEDNDWKTTTKQTERWVKKKIEFSFDSVEKKHMKNEYDSIKIKPKITMTTDDWDARTKRSKKYRDDDDDWDTTTTKKKKYKDDDWDTATKKKKYKDDDWDTTTKKKKYINDDWDTTTKKKKYIDDDWDTTTKKKKYKDDDWDVTTKKSKNYDNNDRNDSWKSKGKKITITPWDRTTRRNAWVKRKDDSYKKPNYGNKPFRSGGGGGFFGRTPIPHIGRQGIYEDK